MADIDDSKKLEQLRKKIFITGYRGGMAHLASCYSCLEILYTLYCKDVLRLDASNPEWKDRDRLILSKGHAGLALFAMLQEKGYLKEEDYQSYLQPGTHIGGEPCMRDLPGVEASTGSLGHGLSIGVGMAIALKSDESPANVYVVLGDGECEEGTIWEAAMSAAAYRLDNLIVILDCNRIQKMDQIENIMGPAKWREKWEAFGWKVDEVDGHDITAMKSAFLQEKEEGIPRLLIAHTIKGKGVSIMENNPKWHFKLPNKKELKVFKEELRIDDSELE